MVWLEFRKCGGFSKYAGIPVNDYNPPTDYAGLSYGGSRGLREIQLYRLKMKNGRNDIGKGECRILIKRLTVKMAHRPITTKATRNKEARLKKTPNGHFPKSKNGNQRGAKRDGIRALPLPSQFYLFGDWA